MKGIFGKKSTPNDKLVQARVERGMTKSDVAGKVDVNLYTYCRWERGQQRPGLRHLRLLCELFQKKPAELGYNLDDIGKRDYGI